MYRYAVKLGLKNNYNEENGIIKKIVRMMSGIGLLHPQQAEMGFTMKKIYARI
jgi:hypothetical protein